MSLYRLPDGKFIPAGRTEHRETWNAAYQSALPAWLAVQTGTGSFGLPVSSTEPAHYKVSASAAGGAYRFWVVPDTYIAQYEEIEWTLNGLKFDTDAGFNVTFGFGSTSNDRGVVVIQNNATIDVAATIRGYLSSASFDDHTSYGFQMQKPNGGTRKPRNVTLLWRVQRHEFYVLEDGEVQAKASLNPAIVKTAVRPMITVGATDGGTHWMKFSSTSIALRHN